MFVTLSVSAIGTKKNFFSKPPFHKNPFLKKKVDMIEKCKAVIFDMDGLMLDTESIVKKAIQTAGEELHSHFSDDLCFRMIGLNAKSVQQLLYEELGNDFPLQDFYLRVQEHSTRIVRVQGIAKKTGLQELLHWLEILSFRKAVGTSSSRKGTTEKLQKTQLLHHFNIIVCGDEVEAGKPAPDIFLKAAQLLEVMPQECIVLEDSAAGIRAASTAEMFPIMVPDLKPPSPEIIALTHQIFPSLHEVKDYLAQTLDLAAFNSR